VNMENNIVSLSGGKDSTAMLIEMLERGEPIHSVVFFDTGWEFPQMLKHIDKLEQYVGKKFWRLRSALPFEYWLTSRPVKSTKDRPEIGIKKGEVHMIGNGWPSISRRWCTRQKADVLDRYYRAIPNAVQCVGYAADEKDRTFSRSLNNVRFPLIEWGLTEADCLAICKRHGFDWGGLYDIFPRVSCFCCPLQSLAELRKLRVHFPELWKQMLKMESEIVTGGKYKFRDDVSVHDLEIRFSAENNQRTIDFAGGEEGK
jgi:3'-phosphoadenosine 5'-phosphosulfate sulfotransferase (PAPS reductase)/FAD synthetase